MDLKPDHPCMYRLKALIELENLNKHDEGFVRKAFIDVWNSLKTRDYGEHMSIIFPPLSPFYRRLLWRVGHIFVLNLMDVQMDNTISILTTRYVPDYTNTSGQFAQNQVPSRPILAPQEDIKTSIQLPSRYASNTPGLIIDQGASFTANAYRKKVESSPHFSNSGGSSIPLLCQHRAKTLEINNSSRRTALRPLTASNIQSRTINRSNINPGPSFINWEENKENFNTGQNKPVFIRKSLSKGKREWSLRD